MDLVSMMMVSAVFLAVIFFVLLVVLVTVPHRPKSSFSRKGISSDLNKIKEQINGDEEEW